MALPNWFTGSGVHDTMRPGQVCPPHGSVHRGFLSPLIVEQLRRMLESRKEFQQKES